MTILVKNCFHWVNFHIVNELLYAGYRVHGYSKAKTKNKADFLMYLGRNSSFSHLTTLANKEYKAIIVFARNAPKDHIKSKRTFWITNNKAYCPNNIIKINVPTIFGEWMPMDEEQMYIQGKSISFQSPKFLEEAIDIKSLSLALIQWLETPYIPNEINVQSMRSHHKNLMLENIIYLRDNRSIYKRLNEVKNHYKKLKYLHDRG